MNTTAQPSSPSPKLQLTLNKQTLEIQMELNALLTAFGAPASLAQAAATVWENDLLIEKFFARHESGLTLEQAQGLTVLMDLSDHDLLNLLLRRQEPEGSLDTQEVREVLDMLRP